MHHPHNNLVPANVVLLRGRLSSDPRAKLMPSGDEMISYEVTTEMADGRCSVPVVWFSPRRPPSVAAGEEVVVLGHVRRRFFRFAGGASSRTEVVASVVARAGTKTATKAVATCLAGFESEPDRSEDPGDVVHH